MKYRSELITPAKEMPVTVDEIRIHLWTIYPEKTSDEYLEMLISAATAHVEEVTWRKLISQTWRIYLDAWPGDRLRLPFGRCSAIESVKWLDRNAVDHALVDGTGYISAIAGDDPSILAPASGWPAGELFDADSIRVQFVAGFGTAKDIPADIKHAIIMLVAHWYETREAVIVGTTVRKVPFAVDAILSPWKIRNG